MANYAVSVVANSGAPMYTGAGTSYVVQTPSGVLYCVFGGSDTGDIYFTKSSDGGLTWSQRVLVSSAITWTQLSIWYDRWSGIGAGLIHCAYTDSANDDVLYRSIDTENSDTLSSETVIFAGASTAANGVLSICRARGGNLCCLVNIDAGTEVGFYRSTDVGATWGSRASPNEAAADPGILLPGWAADNQDMMLIFWDVSADEISRKLYDDSADSWAETSISTGMVDTAFSNSFPNFAAAVDIANSQNVLIAWNGVDTANADLKCWTVTESAITAKTDVITNSTDDQALCALGIDINTGHWHAWYCGKSDGSETVYSPLNVYTKVSKDGGSTWGAETPCSEVMVGNMTIRWLACTMRFQNKPLVAWNNAVSGVSFNYCSASRLLPRATLMLGV